MFDDELRTFKQADGALHPGGGGRPRGLRGRLSGTSHAPMGEVTIADAICDRLVHNAHVVTLAA